MAGENRPKKSAKRVAKGVTVRSIVITVDDEHLPKIDKVATELSSIGVKIEEILKATGLICGTSVCQFAEIRKVPGVLSVEEQTPFDVPPGDSPVH